MTKKTKILLAVTFIAISLRIIFHPARIVLDDHDPHFHNKTVYFHQPMMYVRLISEHKDRNIGFLQHDIEIGRILLRTDSVLADVLVYVPQQRLKPAQMKEKLPPEMEFIIEGSYWHRGNFLKSGFSGNSRYAVLKDKNNIRSIVSFLDFFNSDRPHLSELEFIYKKEQ